MLVAVAIVSTVGALWCLFAGVGTDHPDKGRHTLTAGVLLLLLAATAAAVDDKVAAEGSQHQGSTPADTPVAVSTSDVTAFTSMDGIHSGPLPADLCLARFYDRGTTPAGRWWTTCEEAARLRTVADVRRALAVKVKWGKYDTEVRYTVPKGRSVTYVRGIAAPQCAPTVKICRYPGGGVQYLFPAGLDPQGAVTTLCAPPPAPQPTPSNVTGGFGPCP